MIRPAQPITLTDTETGKTTVVKTVDVTHATPAELAALLGLAQPSTTRA
jgi:alkaline phosphatase